MLRPARSLPHRPLTRFNYNILQIDSFINLYHAILNKTTIKSGTRLINSRPNIQPYGIPGRPIRITYILVSVKKYRSH